MRKQKKYHFIYKTTNLLSGRYYIGMHSTDDLDDGYLGSGTYLRRAINKYGKENFKREILEFCDSRIELKSREEEVVNLREIAKKECMNLRVGGTGSNTINYGIIPTMKTRKKMSKSHMGHTTSDETKRKISETLQGQNFTDERKQNISKGRKGIPSQTGRKFSEESKKKMSKAQKGRVHSKVKCPHCNKVGGGNSMKQWHFDRCKYKK